jgi:hypothetical protein
LNLSSIWLNSPHRDKNFGAVTRAVGRFQSVFECAIQFREHPLKETGLLFQFACAWQTSAAVVRSAAHSARRS